MTEDRTPLFDAGEDRESRFVDELIRDSDTLRAQLGAHLGWSEGWCCCGSRLEIRKKLLRRHPRSDQLDGDVDLLAIPLTLEASGKFRWPPLLDFIAAAEFKVTTVDVEGNVNPHALNEIGQEEARTQARKLCLLGFNRVALVYCVVNEPGLPTIGSSWMFNSVRVVDAADRLSSRLKADATDPFGTLILPIAAIPGRPEAEAGGSSDTAWTIAPVAENPLRLNPIVAARRRRLEDNLERVLRRYDEARLSFSW